MRRDAAPAPAPALAFLALAALASLALAPQAQAHGGGEFPHVNPMHVGLGPGEQRSLELTFEENQTRAAMGNKSFEAGWVFVLNAQPRPGSAPMVVELRPGHHVALGEPVATWTIGAPPAGAPGATASTVHGSALMPVTDVYTLVFRHGGGEGPANLTFFYDQTCNCAGKPIPVEVPQGYVVFNADARQGATWTATFPEPAVHQLEVTLAKRVNERSKWPEDFQVLQRSSQASTRDVGAGPARVHELTWTADTTGRYYFWVQSKAQDPSKFRDLSAVMVVPYFEQDGADPPKGAPLPAALALGALALAALGAARRRA